MDGRGRQGINSGGAPAAASVMPPYYGGGSSDPSSYDRFWTQNSSGTPLAPDPWAPPNPYLPPPGPASQDRATPSYSPASHHNNSPPNSTSYSIPQHSSYPPRIPTNGMNGSNVDLNSFSGPAPPNPLQPVPLPPPYGIPLTPNSSSSPRSNRQYTPSSTPSPHVINQPHQPSPINGINGSASHSSHESSPPNSANANNSFEGYMNGAGINISPTKANGPIESRYPGELKDGDLVQQQYQNPYYQNYAPQYGDQQSITPSYYDSYSPSRRPFDPYQSYQNANPSAYNDSYNSSASADYNALRPSDPDNTVGSNGRRRDSISGMELTGENGTKMDSMGKGSSIGSVSSHHGLSRTNSYDDDANFESVLHGSNDHNMNNSYGQVDHQFSLLPGTENGSSSYQASGRYTSAESQIQPENKAGKLSPKSDESNCSSSKVYSESSKKRERKKKNRSSSSSSSSTNNNISDDDPKSKGNSNKEKSSFLDSGHPQSPLNSNSNSSQGSNSNQSRPNHLSNVIKVEGSNESSQPSSVSEGGAGGEKSPSDPNGSAYETNIKLNATASSNSSESNNVPSSTPKTKKKPWKKAKPVNSEQLLEERERNCAEYIERSLGESKGKVKSEPHSSDFREERNITIDHQKEQQIYEQTFGKLYNSDKDNENNSQSVATGENGEVKEKKDVPLVECGCFPVDEAHPEPGPFYTHLGAAHTLPELREMLETKTGFRGPQLRFEKVIYTGKEGKTSQGCPLAKWIIRRGSYEEQLLFVVKHRKGHKCATAWIVVCCVIWEAVPPHFADNLYDTIVYKLNRFGIPTTRRSDTNEQRSCACQGVDPDTCGAAYSFGCAWSMFFNGCKYARSRNVRKFRLTEEHEEAELEEKVQHLATHLGPLYERVAADSYRNQIEHEDEGLECRLGYRPGRPFSGVTACIDYCSHAHKDAHNMINGCTVTVAFTRNRTLSKGEDEQYHVLPLYKLDDTDEFGSKEGQKQKVKKGQLDILKKFPTKVRIRKVPLLPSRRRGKPKPPSSSGSGSNSNHPPPPKPSDSYSSDLPSLSMPPPPKREKISVFDELNGPSGGSDIFDSRFPHGPTASSHFSNLLMPKSHSKLGMGMGLQPMSIDAHVQSCQISSTVLDADGCPQPIWNHSPYGQLPQSGQAGSSFRSYFDTPLPPNSQYSSPSPAQFSHNVDFGLNSSSRGGGSSSANASNSSISVSNPMSMSGNSNNSGSNSQSSSSSGYSSMSPSILPSFRNTFMTEAESLSMLSSMSPSAGTGSPIADSTSSPRSGKPYSSQQLNLSNPSVNNANPTPFSHHSDSLGLNNPSSYFSSSAPIVPPNPYNSSSSSLYHPHPHHPAPTSCLSSAQSQVGVPFNSSYANSSSSFVPPPGSMDPHHTFGVGMSSWNPNLNINNPPGYSHHGYGAVPPAAPTPYHHHSQMSSLGMNSMTPAAFPHMNQYNPYGSQTNFISPHAAAMHSHHPTNPWVSPLSSFMSAPHHPPPPAFVAPPKPKVIPEVAESNSDNEEAFKDPNLGGVGIALTHGSVILQCAKHEMHATTSLKNPNRMYPSRICLVFYQHKSMNNRFHGWSEWEKKIEAKKLQEVKLINQGKLEASPRKMKQLIKEGYLADTP